MLKDDRMMGMLTFVVIMLTVGTFVQRADFFQRLMGTAEPAAALKADVAEARIGKRAEIDVLANDTGVEAPDALTIATPPECGSASARDGRILYTATADCLGTQRLRYGLGADGPSAELRISVRAADAAEGVLRTVIRPGVPQTTVSAAEPKTQSGGQSGRQSGAEPGTTSGPQPEATAATAGQAPGSGPAGAGPAGAGRAATDPAPASAGSGAARQTAQAAPGTADAAPSALAVNRAGPDAVPEPGAAAQRCNFPPTLTVAAQPAAMTEVAIDSPCDRDVVAVLAYDGLRFAIPLNFRGAGSLEVPGFQRSTEATITLERGGEMQFNLPFQGIERIDRVAIAWEEDPALALNAFEFGARPGGQGHLTPEEPGSFEAVRRAGGGWLASYEPEEGKGQRIDVYSFWRRHGGPSGVVKLALGTGNAAGACGSSHPGSSARGIEGADYVVLRSNAGRLERSRLGRVAPLDCTVLAGGAGGYIENAVDDLIVRRR